MRAINGYSGFYETARKELADQIAIVEELKKQSSIAAQNVIDLCDLLEKTIKESDAEKNSIRSLRKQALIEDKESRELTVVNLENLPESARVIDRYDAPWTKDFNGQWSLPCGIDCCLESSTQIVQNWGPIRSEA